MKRRTIFLTAFVAAYAAIFLGCSICAYKDDAVAVRQAAETESERHIHQSAGWFTVKEPACTEDGLSVHICSECHDAYEEKLLHKTGHNGKWQITVAPTCMSKGERQLICKNCQELLEIQELPCSGHEYTWVTTKEPECKEEGLKELVCRNCWEKKAEKKIEALGHTYVDCVCERCGYQTSLDKEHHQMFFDEYAAAAAGMELTGDVVIPSEITYEGESYEIIGIGYALCYGNKSITSVTLPDTIKYIGSHAFDYCENMASCNLPDGLVSIGTAAFQCCFSLKHIDLPDSIRTIGNFAFNHCSSADNSSIRIPSSIELLGKYPEAPAHMFYDCGTDAFTEFEIDENKNGYLVQDGILYARDGKTLVSIPRGKTFENGIFEIPDTVENLGELSFSRNTNISTVIISDRMEFPGKSTEKEWQSYNNIGNQLSISTYVYSNVKNYQVKETNQNYTSVDGVLYTKDLDTLVAVPNKYEGVLNIPEGVRTWQWEALWNSADDFKDLAFNRISEVHIPASMESINEGQVTAVNKIADYYSTRISVADGNRNYKVDESGHLVKIETEEEMFIKNIREQMAQI